VQTNVRVALSALVSCRDAACVVIALVLLAACSRVAPVDSGGRHSWTVPGYVRIGMTDEPDNLNPMFAHTDATDQIDALIFAPVFRYDAKGEFVPELAVELPSYANGGISKDSRTIVLHWRHNVRWSDGAPLTARDLRFTWRAVTNKRNATKALYGWDDIDAIDVPDPYTAVVRLKRPNADVLGIFGGGGGAAYPPLPEHLLAKLPDLNQATFNARPISSGPWLLKEWKHGSGFEFTPNTTYWRGPPKLQRLSVRIVPDPDSLFAELQTHEIDILGNADERLLPQIYALPGVTRIKHLIANWRRLAINCGKPALSDARVRLALAEAVDWDRLNATLYHGFNRRSTSDIPPDSWAAPTIPFYKHSVTDAAALLDRAGWKLGPNGVRLKGGAPLSLTISATNKPGNEQAEVQMQQQLKPLGVALSIKNYPASFLFAQNGPLYGGSYDLEWSIDTNGPDPDNQGNWSGDFIPPRGANTSFLRDPEITQLSDAALRTFDRAKRKALYQREEERIHALVPTVFFYWENAVAAYNSDLRNYKPAEYITDNWNSWEWEI
jgi:peptide/nickel transport system substrate-binding protein